MSTLIQSEFPAQLKDLVWNEFFVSKSRGVSIAQHFPWAVNENRSTWYVVQYDNATLIGGLVVRDVDRCCLCGCLKIGAIGLVCIAPAYRGQRYAANLLKAAISEAKKRGYDALTLWTSKWNVYTSHGFKLLDDSVFGLVNMADTLIKEEARYLVESTIFQKDLGLPPFAFSGTVLKNVNAEVFLIKDRSGLILAKWSGNDIDVAQILGVMPERKWRINAHQDDPLLAVLKSYGANMNLQSSNLQMWLPLKTEFADYDWTKVCRFSVLDRI